MEPIERGFYLNKIALSLMWFEKRFLRSQCYSLPFQFKCIFDLIHCPKRHSHAMLAIFPLYARLRPPHPVLRLISILRTELSNRYKIIAMSTQTASLWSIWRDASAKLRLGPTKRDVVCSGLLIRARLTMRHVEFCLSLHVVHPLTQSLADPSNEHRSLSPDYACAQWPERPTYGGRMVLCGQRCSRWSWHTNVGLSRLQPQGPQEAREMEVIQFKVIYVHVKFMDRKAQIIAPCSITQPSYSLIMNTAQNGHLLT